MPNPAPRARVGIIGQSFTVPSPRVGRLDAYPEAGHMRTSAMAEGAIDGEAESYEVAGPYATRFVFSRFDAPRLGPPLAAPPAQGTLTAAEAPVALAARAEDQTEEQEALPSSVDLQ